MIYQVEKRVAKMAERLDSAMTFSEFLLGFHADEAEGVSFHDIYNVCRGSLMRGEELFYRHIAHRYNVEWDARMCIDWFSGVYYDMRECTSMVVKDSYEKWVTQVCGSCMHMSMPPPCRVLEVGYDGMHGDGVDEPITEDGEKKEMEKMHYRRYLPPAMYCCHACTDKIYDIYLDCVTEDGKRELQGMNSMDYKAACSLGEETITQQLA